MPTPLLLIISRVLKWSSETQEAEAEADPAPPEEGAAPADEPPAEEEAAPAGDAEAPPGEPSVNLAADSSLPYNILTLTCFH